MMTITINILAAFLRDSMSLQKRMCMAALAEPADEVLTICCRLTPRLEPLRWLEARDLRATPTSPSEFLETGAEHWKLIGSSEMRRQVAALGRLQVTAEGLGGSPVAAAAAAAAASSSRATS